MILPSAITLTSTFSRTLFKKVNFFQIISSLVLVRTPTASACSAVNANLTKVNDEYRNLFGKA
jgi:hypothetical protein